LPPTRRPAARSAENGRLTGLAPAPSFEAKILSPQDLAQWLERLPRPLVFTNGVFDLLHRGHVTYLAQARSMGAGLLVALNSDASAKRLGKGADRPLNRLEDRLALVAALEAVSAVTWFDEDTPEALIRACRPEVLVKGGDWSRERIAGAQEVLTRGGRVESIPFEHERSTTALVKKIRDAG
jgi:D-glycero-beta-D-manno-heptose 1-phosphate adenylyltransferase